MSGENLRSSHMQHSGAAQPAPGLCQLVHVVPDTLCDGLTFQLTEHRCDVHHRAAHGAGRVKTFTDGHKVDAQPSQFFNQAGKVADVAADAVQTVDHNGLEFPVLGRSHHLFEVRAVQVAAGKALVLKDDRLLCCGIAVVGADIFTAEVEQCYLMPDETALRELSEGVIEKLKLLTDAEFGELEFPPDGLLPPAGGVYRLFYNGVRCGILNL